MKSSLLKTTNRGIIITMRDSPERKSGQAIWP